MIDRFNGGADGLFASFTLNAAGASQDNLLSATFNAAGQIASRTQSNDDYAFTGSGNFNHGYVSNGLNQYAAVQGITHSYDANDNLTGDGTNTWVYDVANRLVVARGALRRQSALRSPGPPLPRRHRRSGIAIARRGLGRRGDV